MESILWPSGTNGTTNSGKPEDMDCFISFNPSGTADFSKYTGPVAPATQREWISRLQGSSNWTPYLSSSDYQSSGPDYNSGFSISINSGGFTAGMWEGDDTSTPTDWFDCSNWQNLNVPDKQTTVMVPAASSNNIVIAAGADTAVAKSVTVQSGKTLTITGNKLSIYGDMTVNGTLAHTGGEIEMAGTSPATISGNKAIEVFRIDIDNTSGVTIDTTLRVSDAITLTNGDFTLDGDTLFVVGGTMDVTNGRIVGANAGSTVWLNGTGMHNLPISTLDYLYINNTGGDITLTENVQLNGTGGKALSYLAGNIILNGKTLTIEDGDIDGSAGTFIGDAAANVILKGTGSTTNGLRFAPASGQVLNNLTINRLGTGAETEIGSDLTVNNQFTLTNGQLYLANNKLTLKGPFSKDNGTMRGGVSATLRIDQMATSTPSMTIDSIEGGLSRLEIARFTGLSLNQSLSVRSEVAFESGAGNVTTGDDTLMLGSVGTISGETDGRKVIGYVSAERILNANSTVDFGNLGMEIQTAAQAMGSTKVTRRTGPAGIVIATEEDNESIARTFDIEPDTNTNLNATLVFNYFEEELNGLPEADLAAFRSENGSIWTLEGGTPNTAANNVTVTGIDAFFEWTLGDPINSTLPITLANFTGSINERREAVLVWNTLSEYNNAGFEVEKSANGKDFRQIGFVDGANEAIQLSTH